MCWDQVDAWDPWVVSSSGDALAAVIKRSGTSASSALFWGAPGFCSSQILLGLKASCQPQLGNDFSGLISDLILVRNRSHLI